MLILTRKPGQAFVVDGIGTVRVVAVGSGRVRLALDMPKATSVRRGEVEDRDRDRVGRSGDRDSNVSQGNGEMGNGDE